MALEGLPVFKTWIIKVGIAYISQIHELSLVLTAAISGWVSGDKANVFVADHDTERVSFLYTWFLCLDDSFKIGR